MDGEKTKYLDDVLDKIETAGVILDSDGKIIYLNKTFQEIVEKTFMEVKGEIFHQAFIIPQEIEEFKQKILKDLNPIQTQFHVMASSGDIKLIQFTKKTGETDKQIVLTGRDISDLKIIQKSLKTQLKLEKTLSKLACQFINQKQLDDLINNCLQDIGKACSASRAYIFQFNPEYTTMTNTHEWVAENTEPQIQNLQNLPCSEFKWWMEKLLACGEINIEDVNQMPEKAENEKQILKNQDIKTLIVFAIYKNNELTGFIGLDNIHKKNTWTPKETNLVKKLSEILGYRL